MNQNKNSVITIGNFDGVHVGHQALLKKVTTLASSQQMRSGALFFYPHPMSVLRSEERLPLSTPQMRRRWMLDLGLDFCEELVFDIDRSKQSAEQFLDDLILRFGMKHFVVGPTTSIGANRKGTPEVIKNILDDKGIAFDVLDAYRFNGEVISSSLIRESISKGNVALASSCLGRFFSTEGAVVHDRGLGRTLGFPTLNLKTPQTLLPPHGVYVTKAHYQNHAHLSVTNIGYRPSITQSLPTLSIETHVIDVDIAEHPTELRIEWIDRLRAEQKFSSLDALKAQIAKDVGRAKEYKN